MANGGRSGLLGVALAVAAVGLLMVVSGCGGTVSLLTLEDGDQYAATATFQEYTGGCCGDVVLVSGVSPFLPRQ